MVMKNYLLPKKIAIEATKDNLAKLQAKKTSEANKKKAEIEFPLLTPTQVNLINNEVSNVSKPFIPVEITYPSGGTKTFNAYCGDVAYPVYGLVKGKYCVVGFKLDLIEK